MYIYVHMYICGLLVSYAKIVWSSENYRELNMHSLAYLRTYVFARFILIGIKSYRYARKCALFL